MYDEYGDYVEDDSVYHEADVASITTATKSTMLPENIKLQKKMMDEVKKADRGYTKIHRFVDGKKKTIEVYATDVTPGNRIRGAIGGSYYSNFRVGSKDEDIFYKVGLCTGECRENSVLFFDTPEQYERHMCTTISQPEKEAWYEKFNRERVARQ